MKKALALLAYNRLDYLEPVWASLRSQTIASAPLSATYDVHVFQDGLWAGEPAAGRAGHRQVSDYLDRLPPWATVTRQAENLGIARHYDLIEKKLFVERGYDYAVFCEDDLILAPGYLWVIDRMADKFHDDHRVGMVSAHPDDPTVPIELQRAHRNRWAPMGHNWGYGISRAFWQRRQPLVECYLDLIRGAPYRERNHPLIYTWLERIGFRPLASSQDHVKTCATYALGAVKLSTYANFGLPIGRSGVHCTPALFERMGFDRTVVFDEQLDVIGDLTEDTHRELWQQKQRPFGNREVRVITDPDAHDVAAWEARLTAGDFHPRRVVADFLTANRAMSCPCGSGRRLKHCHGRLP